MWSVKTKSLITANKQSKLIILDDSHSETLSKLEEQGAKFIFVLLCKVWQRRR